MAPLSPLIVHRSNSFHRAKQAEERQHRTEVLPEQLSRHFKAARDKCQCFKGYKAEELPTFHEIRALCAWLYKQQGRELESVQLLMGHGGEEMTQHYQGGHAIQWAETWADLDI